MARITYEMPKERALYNVRLDGKVVGAICQNEDGYYYYKPKGGKPGELYQSLPYLKASIEAE